MPSTLHYESTCLDWNTVNLAFSCWAARKTLPLRLWAVPCGLCFLQPSGRSPIPLHRALVGTEGW